MSLLLAEELLRKIENAREFPPVDYAQRDSLALYQAIRESDTKKLKPNWWDEEYETSRDFIIDSLGARIPETWADLLFGEEPEFEPIQKSNVDELEKFVDDNNLPSELHWAEQLSSSEGEVWYRLLSVPMLGRVFIEWHSRMNVVPYFIGQRLAAVAFVSWLEIDGDSNKIWVYLEVHSEGVVLNRLYFTGIGGALKGNEVPLGDREETAQLRPQWLHPLPMLGGRLINKRGKDVRIGGSDYKGIASLLLALNEIANIGQENARLTAKQRVIIPERFLTSRGQLPRGAEIIIATEVDQDPTKIKNDLAQVEWEFDAEALIAYKGDLTDTILTRARMAPQLIGRHTESAETGPGYKARLIDSVLAAQGKAKKWDEYIPEILKLAWQLEALPIGAGGCGVAWKGLDGDKFPVFKRNGNLPEDEESRSRRIVTEVNAKILSRRSAMEENNPTWGPDRVQDEMDRIEEEEQQALERMQQQFQFKSNIDQSQLDRQKDDAADKGVQDPGRLPLQPGKRRSTARPNADRVVKS